MFRPGVLAMKFPGYEWRGISRFFRTRQLGSTREGCRKRVGNVQPRGDGRSAPLGGGEKMRTFPWAGHCWIPGSGAAGRVLPPQKRPPKEPPLVFRFGFG